MSADGGDVDSRPRAVGQSRLDLDAAARSRDSHDMADEHIDDSDPLGPSRSKNPNPPSDEATVRDFRPAPLRTTVGGDEKAAPEKAPDRATVVVPITTEAGDLFGNFKLLRVIGRGGQGTVYLAHDERLRRNVALKIQVGGGVLSDEKLERFRREAEITSRLDHPGICTIFESGRVGAASYIAMRYVEGRPLSALVAEVRSDAAGDDRASIDKDTVMRFVRIVAEAARALAAAHDGGVIHRDVKPGNIMVTDDDRPVILDFGFARDLDAEDETLTRTGDLFGTPAYMSPEQLSSKSENVDVRADVWALGATLYECVTLKKPFDRPTREAVYQAIKTTEPPRANEHQKCIPRDLVTILETALTKDRNRRYQSAEAFAADLEALLDDRPIAARRVSFLGRTVRWAKREPATFLLIAALVVTLPAIAGLVVFQSLTSEEREAGRRLKIEMARDEMLSRAFYHLGDGRNPAAAVPEFERALGLGGESPESVAGLVLAHLQQKDVGAAKAALNRHASAIGDREDTRKRLDDLVAGYESTGSLASASRRLSAKGRSDVDHYIAGTVALTSGHAGDVEGFRVAFGEFTRAVLMAPRPRALFYEERAHAAGHIGDLAAVRETVDAIVERWPDSAGSIFSAGRALIVAGKVDEGIALVERATTIDPNFAESWILIATTFEDTDQTVRAETAARKALALSPNSARVHFILGNVIGYSGRIEEGSKHFEEAIRLEPGYYEPRVNLADHLIRAGKKSEAIKLLEEAIAITPRRAEAWKALGNILVNEQKFAEALRAFEHVAAVSPKTTIIQTQRGFCLYRVGKKDEAIAMLKDAAEFDAKAFECRHLLARFLREMKREKEARPFAEEAARLAPDNAEVRYHCGHVLALLEDFDGAIREMGAAVKLKPDDEKQKYMLATMYSQVDLTTESVELLEQCVAKDPTVWNFWLALGHDARKSGRYERAAEAYEKVRETAPKDSLEMRNAATWVRASKDLMLWREQLQKIEQGAPRPTDGSSLVFLADCAARLGKLRIAAEMFKDSFASPTPMSKEQEAFFRAYAARAAIRFAASLEGDAGAETAKEFRDLGRAWFAADVDYAEESWNSERLPDDALKLMIGTWRFSRHYASVRGQDALSRMSEAERDAWAKVWAKIERIAREI